MRAFIRPIRSSRERQRKHRHTFVHAHPTIEHKSLGKLPFPAGLQASALHFSIMYLRVALRHAGRQCHKANNTIVHYTQYAHMSHPFSSIHFPRRRIASNHGPPCSGMGCFSSQTSASLAWKSGWVVRRRRHVLGGYRITREFWKR